jgi:ATP-dependent helicase HepA
VVEQANASTKALKAKVEQGRDRLLELNASGGDKIDEVMDSIVVAENPVKMLKFMTRLFDALGVVQEEKDEQSFILRHGDAMLFPIPGLPDDGMEITYKRDVATRLEHLTYISGDSELVTHCLDSVLTDVIGKSSICFVNQPDTPVGAYWIEIIALLNPVAEASLQLYQFLPPTPLRVCVDAKNQSSEEFFEPIFKVKPKMAQQLIGALQVQINAGIAAALAQATAQLDQIKQAALHKIDTNLSSEIARLSELQKVNPAIRDEEIAYIVEQKTKLSAVIEAAEPFLDSVRVVVNNRR